MKVSVKEAAMITKTYLKEGLYPDFSKSLDKIQEHPTYKFYMLGGLGSYMLASDKLEEGQSKMVHHQMVSQHKAMVEQEMCCIKHGDDIAAAKVHAAKVYPSGSFSFCHAIRKVFRG